MISHISGISADMLTIVAFLPILPASGDIETIHSQEPCLEDIFINLTGEKINDK